MRFGKLRKTSKGNRTQSEDIRNQCNAAFSHQCGRGEETQNAHTGHGSISVIW